MLFPLETGFEGRFGESDCVFGFPSIVPLREDIASLSSFSLFVHGIFQQAWLVDFNALSALGALAVFLDQRTAKSSHVSAML